MSGDGLLHLRWNNHHSSFMQVLATLRNKETYSDITLACDGKFYSVHKLVLSTCSDYFVEIMSKTPCKHPIIVLKDIRHEDLEALLNYMYLGEVNVIQSDLASLIKAAECLQIKGLAVPDESTHLEENITKIEADYGIEGKQKKRKVDDVTIDAYNSNKKSSHKTKEQYNSDERDTQHEEENTDVDTAYGENQPKNKTFDNTYIEQQAVPLSMVGEIVIKEEPDLKYEDESSKVTKEDAIGESRCTPQGAELHAESGEQMDFQEQLDVEDRKDSNPAVNQPYSIQPQSFEDIVSQAIPGPSLQIDPGHGWDGAQSKRETSSFHLQGFSEQESVSPHHHRMQPMGQASSGLGQHAISRPLQQPPSVPPETTTMHHNYQASYPEVNTLATHDPANIRLTVDQLKESIDKKCCQACGYRGQDVAQLRKHLRIHTGEKPYQCPKCYYCSAQSSNLKAHIKRHHFDPDQQELQPSNQYLINDTVFLD